MEKLMRSISGVEEVTCGYANGSREEDADYRTVCSGRTGFRETVKVVYDPSRVSLEALLLAFFYVIDPAQENRQGNDVGSQYQTGVYYKDKQARETTERIAAIESGRVERFAVEIGPLRNFYPAEEYHQNYLDKNPGGYCHIPMEKIALFSKMTIDPGEYRRPAEEIIRGRLTEEECGVTQNRTIMEEKRMVPRDPVMLLSFMNVKLRDYYGSLEDCCEDLELDKNEIAGKLEAIGYRYDGQRNQFV